MPETATELAQFRAAPAPLQSVRDAATERAGVELLVKRLDLVHPYVSGNKWYKLKYNLAAARQLGHQTLLTFGGAFSNHVYATAAAGRLFGFRTIGLIRGEAHLPLNPVLQFAAGCGMQLHYIDRQTYQQKHTDPFIQQLTAQFGPFYLLPEGGSNALAVQGCAEILADLPAPVDYVCCACGTGSTLAGLLAGADANHLGQAQFLGFPVLKGGDFLASAIADLVGKPVERLTLLTQYHFGGYAKTKPALQAFIAQFMAQHPIPLEPVYTGKLFYGVYDLLQQGYFFNGAKVLVVHSGGIRG